jgi:acyl carrier protein
MGMDTVELVLAIEESFGIQVDDRVWETTGTVGAICKVVTRSRPDLGRREIELKVRGLVADHAGLTFEEVTLEKHIVRDLGLD